MFVLSILGFLALIPLGAVTRHETRFLPFGFSPIDYLLAVMVLLNVWAAQSMRFERLLAVARPMQRSAVMTFGLYLFHLPIVFCLLAVLPRSLSPALQVPIILVATLAIVAALTGPTEALKRWMKQSLVAIASTRLGPGAGKTIPVPVTMKGALDRAG